VAATMPPQLAPRRPQGASLPWGAQLGPVALSSTPGPPPGPPAPGLAGPPPPGMGGMMPPGMQPQGPPPGMQPQGPPPPNPEPDKPVSNATPPPLSRLPSIDPLIEMELTAKIRDLFYRARNKRRPMLEQWDKNYRSVHKTQGQIARANMHLPRPKVNEIFATLDTMVAWKTDQQPTFDATPNVPPLNPAFNLADELCQDLKTVIRSTWQVDKVDAEVEKVVWDGYIYGIGFFKTSWDGTAYRGFGNAKPVRLDPYSMYVDPDATSMDDSNYFIEARTVSRQELERRFPGATKRLNTDFFTEDIDAAQTKLDTAVTRNQAMANPGAMHGSNFSSYSRPGENTTVDATMDPGVTLVECWLRTPKEQDGRIYDSWRCLVMAGNRILMDKMAEDLWSHGQHPYDRYVPVETGEFYGHALVEDLIPLQNSINRILGSIEHNIELMGNPILKEDIRAGLARTAITNKPGQRLPMNPGGALDWMMPPQMHPQMSMDIIKFYIGEIERISGLSAIVRGASPTGRNAQGVIDSVQEAAFVRIRKGLRNLSRCIGGAGEKMAAQIVEFYDKPRLISLIGPSGEKTSVALRSNHFYLPSPEGQAPMRFQLLIDAGEAASQSRGQRIAEADALYAMGAIDEEAVLEVHAIPGWQNIAKRVQDQKAQAGTVGQPPTQRAAARR